MNGGQVLVVPVGDDLYAVPVDWVLEVVPAPVLTELVTAPPVVLGLFNLRGVIVPLLDTAALLGTGTVTAGTFAVVLGGPQGRAALAVTGLPHRAVLDSASGPSELPGTAGVFRVNQAAVVLLDPALLLTAEFLGGTPVRASV